MFPTQPAVILFAAGIPISLGLVVADERLWPIGLAYLGLAILFTGADGLRALPRSALGIEVAGPDVLYLPEGDDLHVLLTVADGWPAATVEAVCNVGNNLKIPSMQVARIGPGRRVSLAIELVPHRRGIAQVHHLCFRWRGPWGLMVKHLAYPLSLELRVVPNVRAVRDAAVRFSSWDLLFGFKPQSQQGDGSDFESLRDYVPGLDHRSIDWKHSARHHSLVCKEFRAERNHQIILAFDTGHLMSEPIDGAPRLDHAINAGLLLGYMSLRGGDRIGTFAFDSQVRQYAEPVGGLHRFKHFLRASAELEYRHEETNFTLGLMELLTRLNRRTLVILQTEFVDTITAELMVENLKRLAARHLIVFVTLQDPSLYSTVGARPRTPDDVTRSVIADGFIRDRLVVFERLRRMGVHCLEAPGDRIGIELVNQYISIKRRELI